MLVEDPLFPFPLQFTVLVPKQGVNVELNVSPEQMVIGFGEAVTVGTSLMWTNLGGGADNTFPQASTTVGGGTLRTVIVSQVHGQLGMVRGNGFATDPVEHPAGAPAVIVPVIQGCVIV